MFDLTIPDGVQACLERTPFPASNVVALEGGYANFTYRITLREPYATAGADAPIKTMVMKHAESYMAYNKDLPFAVERQEFECLALKLIPKLVTPSSTLNIPTLYYEDRVNWVMLMSDSGPHSRTLRAILQDGPLSDNVAQVIGTDLGTFLARLHTTTRNPRRGTIAHTAKTAFAPNHHGGMLVSAVFYGSVVPTFTEDPPLLSPPLSISPETLARLDAAIKNAQARIKKNNDVLAMGDFRPGNFLVVLEPSLHVTMVDWEVARPSFPGIDVGQFLAELLLVRVFHPASRGCIDIIVSAFMRAYRAIMISSRDSMDSRQRLKDIAYDAATHIGAYVIMIAPRMPWGGPEPTREIVQEGVEYILRPVDGDDTWLRRSLVGGLWG